MIAYARHEGHMRAPVSDKDRTPRRAHLEALAKRGNARAISELQGPPLPFALRGLWMWFCELDAARGFDGMTGPTGFTYEQVDAWARLTGRRPQPHEVRALFTLDATVRVPGPPKVA